MWQLNYSTDVEDSKETLRIATSRVMNKQLQAHMAKEHFRKKGYEADSIDFEAEIDSSLSYPENITLLTEKFRNKSEEEFDGLEDLRHIAVKRWIRYKFRHPETTTTWEDFIPY